MNDSWMSVGGEAAGGSGELKAVASYTLRYIQPSPKREGGGSG